MTAALSIFVVLAVAAFVVFPLLGDAGEAELEAVPGGNELWNREKAVAVMAITEADFDRATGKLSDDDYRILRADYEGRALQAMEEIDRLVPEPASGAAAAGSVMNFCPSCGRRFEGSDAFCGGCGRPRAAAV